MTGAFVHHPIRNDPMTRSPAAPDSKIQGGSRSLRELSSRLLALGDDAKTASLALAARSALRAMPLLERLSWYKPLPKQMRAALGRDRMSNSAIVLGTFRSAATAWVAARFPAFGMSDRFHEIKHEAAWREASKMRAKPPPAALRLQPMVR